MSLRITSKTNPTFLYLKKLLTPKYRNQEKKFLIFGEDIIQLAKEKNLIEKSIGLTEEYDITLSKELLNDLQLDTKFDVGSVCSFFPFSEVTGNKIIALDNIQDPKNLGSIFRSALAFGFELVLSLDCVDCLNPKVIRASKGYMFQCKFTYTELPLYLAKLQENGYKIIPTFLSQNSHPLPKNEKVVILLGNEGHGLSLEYKKYLDHNYIIETNDVESLSISHAATILMYELNKK
jgi:TrmH family RNA methyltransferase